MSENLLSQETSPYLLQHQDNPVHWRAWGPDALAEAKAANKPILLSVGYAACHWCHVMAHESFEDEAIAAVMNDLFVNIKVDREERPDIDTIYQSALALLGQQGGWPLTMFLTPDGEPFWGGTYFPSEAKWGRPGFTEVLQRVSGIYHTDSETIEKNRSALVDRLNQMASNERDGTTLRHDSVEQVAEKLVRGVDYELGGLNGAPKFPNPPIFRLFWRAWQKTGDQNYRRALTVMLDRMSEGGIYDHLGGGYARYSVDDRWLAPHFEKMLYDNAQIIELLTWVWQEDRNPLFERRIRETVSWLEREMIAENGAFAASLDADSEGEEGKFYVWSAAEIADLLGAETDFFAHVYDVSEAGNWEGKNILNRLNLGETPDEVTEARLEPLRQRLLEARALRIRPGWDDKVLADWNGLTVAAVANAGAALGDARWIRIADQTLEALVEDLSRPDSREILNHSFRNRTAKHDGMLDDYANMARAALIVFELTGNRAHLESAVGWVQTLNDHFWDNENGGYFYTADTAEALIVRTKNALDNAVPAGNGTMMEVLARLYFVTGDQAYRDRAEELAMSFSAAASQQAPSHSTLICGMDYLLHADQIAIIGNREDEDVQALLDVVYTTSLPNQSLQVIGTDEVLGAHHPAYGKAQMDGKATAYVCRGTVCSLPITDPNALREQLNTL
ncbi:MAG: thioredoxin domain-containing protein [Alphaproteobacteria bacterium]